MLHSLRTTWAYAKIELIRSLRDPITTIVLFGIPIILVLVFGTLVNNSDSISVRVAIVNHSQEEFAKDFEKSLGEVTAFKLPEEKLSFDKAKDEMNNDNLDGIIELPANFGSIQNDMPAGNVKVYYDQADAQTGDIVASIMRSVVEDTNKQLVDTPTPVSIERAPININEASAFDNIFAIFTGMAVMMVGVFAVASVFPTAKKTGVLRRLHATPIKASEVILGTMISYAVIGIIGVALLTTLALTLFDLNMRGDWLTYGAFILFSTFVMLGFGLAIGGIAKNSTQSDVIGQIVFIASLAVSGVWFPRALMPEFLQNITAFLPLTPVIDGIRGIVTENATLVALWPELAVLATWGIIVYAVGIRTFRWE
jgi:ABC-2 type transport system permease protein